MMVIACTRCLTRLGVRSHGSLSLRLSLSRGKGVRPPVPREVSYKWRWLQVWPVLEVVGSSPPKSIC